MIGIGAGGHAKALLDALLGNVDFEIVGLLDANPNLFGSLLLGVPILGDDRQLQLLLKRGVSGAFVGLGGTRDNSPRRAVAERLLALGFDLLTIVHPRAVVSRYATLASGAVALASATIGPGSQIGTNVIVNTAAIVEHDCRVDDHAHVASGACLAGGVHVHAEAHIGAGSVIREGTTIGRRAIVGAGSVVVRDVPDDCTVVGVPARPLTLRSQVR